MKRAFWTAAALIGLAVLARRAAKTVPPAASFPPPAAVSPAVDLLEELLAARNDNDPRLDSAFNDLSEDARRAFRARYAQLPREKRNERGTIVYLLGKNLRSPEDWAFMREVAAEEPCLSLADCSKPGLSGEPGEAVTLAYPSLVALTAAQKALEAGRDARAARTVIEAGLSSRAPAAAALAQRLALRFPARRS